MEISSTWQTDMLYKRILLSASAAKTSPPAKLHLLPKVTQAFFCTGHTPNTCLAHKYYPTWPVTHSPFHRVMMGSIWVQLQIFFFTFYGGEKKPSAWEHFYIYRKIQKSSSYVKLVPETCQEQPESWLSDGILMPCSWGSCIIFSRE